MSNGEAEACILPFNDRKLCDYVILDVKRADELLYKNSYEIDERSLRNSKPGLLVHARGDPFATGGGRFAATSFCLGTFDYIILEHACAVLGSSRVFWVELNGPDLLAARLA